MSSLSPLQFWHTYCGQFLSTSDVLEDSAAVTIPYRTKKGIQPIRIGNIDVYYAASTEKSMLIGQIEMPNTKTMEFVPTERVSARKHLAQWLILEAKTPFLIGVIGKANPVSSFKISQSNSQVFFCEKNAGFAFNLDTVRHAQKLIKESGLEWKKVAAALHLYETFKQDQQTTADIKAKNKLIASFDKLPALRDLLPRLHIKPNSGNYTILSWFFIERLENSTESTETSPI